MRLALICLVAGLAIVQTGHFLPLAYGGQPRPQCPVPGHAGPVCHMGACASYDAGGKPTGSKCSKDCAEKCCSCDIKCNRHHESPDGEEGQ